jgi:hypothetical protein
MEALTNFHCQTQHSLSRKELIDQFGLPKYVSPAMRRDVQEWIRSTRVLTKLDFDLAQLAARSQVRKGS